MVKCRNIYKIDISKSVVKPMSKYNKTKEVLGWDTETEKGKNFLLAYYNNDGDKEILDSDNAEEVLTFLCRKKFKNKFNFFYNITYDFQALIKTLPIENLFDLVKRDKTIYKKWFIKVIPNKMFGITLLKKVDYTKFYDLAQFFNHNSLDNSGEKFLGYKKIKLKDFGIDIKNLSFDRYKKDVEYKQTLRKYLYRDCEITKKLADKLINMVSPYINPKYFYSQASFSQQYFLENINHSMYLPKKKILDYAMKSYQGGRFEVIKRGHFERSHIYDIKSAYPEQNVKVPDLSNGTWKETNEYDAESLVSLYKVDTNIYDIPISPAKFQLKDSLLTYPIGKFKDMYINKKEYECIVGMGFKVKIKKGFHYFDKDPIYPYKFLKDFYNMKEQYKNDGQKELSWIPKIIINGFYGKTIQVIDTDDYTRTFRGDKDLKDVFIVDNQKIYNYKRFTAGKIFNPIVANEITANTRVKLFESCIKHMDNVIGFQTDSIITDKKLPLKFGDKLGDWEVEKENERMIIIGSGVYQLLGENPKIRMRGFGKKIDLHDKLKENMNKSLIDVKLTRNNKLKKTMKLKLSDEEKMEKFNLILDEIRQININFDRKRKWDRNFDNCKDVLESQINSKPLIL